jgi:acyl dehydratase
MTDALDAGSSVTTAERLVTESDIAIFGALTGDSHPQHTDLAWAARSEFGGLIAHGLLVLSCAVGLAPLDPRRVVALRALRDVVFKRPVRPGDAIRLAFSVESVAPLPNDHELVTTVWKIVNDSGATVIRARAEVVCRRVPRAMPTPGPELDGELEEMRLVGLIPV